MHHGVGAGCLRLQTPDSQEISPAHVAAGSTGWVQVFVFSQRCPIKTALCHRTTTFDVALKESSGCDQIRQEPQSLKPLYKGKKSCCC